MPPTVPIVTKHQVYPHFTSKHITDSSHQIHAPQHHLSQIQSVDKYSHHESGRLRTGTVRIFRVAQTWQTVSCRSNRQRKTRHQHEFDTPWDSPQTQPTQQRQTTQPANPKWALRVFKKFPGAQFRFQKTENGPRAYFSLFFERTTNGQP